MTERPQLWVFVGQNGAGETTLVRRYWVAAGIPVVNPDDIARSVNPGRNSEPVMALRAGKEAARLRRAHIAGERSFAIEMTLSGHSELRTMADARAAGFTVNLIFIGIAGPVLPADSIMIVRASSGSTIGIPAWLPRTSRSRSPETTRSGKAATASAKTSSSSESRHWSRERRRFDNLDQRPHASAAPSPFVRPDMPSPRH